MADGELQADALDDLTTTNCKLSIWQIDDGLENLERVVTALAANSDNFSNVDYAIVKREILSGLNIKIEKSKGDTADEEANSEWHYDLIELTAMKRFELAKKILTEAQRKRIMKKDTTNLIVGAAKSKQISLDKVRSDKLRTKIRELIT